MKKTICVIIAAIVLLAAYMVFKPKTVIYPHIYGDSIPGAVSTSYGMPLNFKIFREYRREKVNVNVYSGNKEDTTEGKEPLAVFDKAFEKKGNTIETVRFIWDTPAEPGDYFVEFYTSYFNGETWLDSPNRKYENFKVISPCTKHTFVENANVLSLNLAFLC